MTLLKPKVLHFESLPSTNTELARLASEGAAEGLAVVADEQTAGRGRLQRMWSSPKGAGLYFSLLLRPVIPQNQWPLITLMAAMAVAEALLEACDLETDIKWPNDLLSGERKICGILAEAIETPSGRAVILGIGINLTQDAFPEELANVATSVAAATGREPEREQILTALLASVSRWYPRLAEPTTIIDAWSQRSSYASGKHVKVSNGDDVWKGETCGLESDGALRVRMATGEIKVVRAGDVYHVRQDLPA